jgi:tRNA (guanine37-N1)-methyltransferase
MMRFSILTIFPEMVRPYMEDSILARAQRKRLISIELINPRNFAHDKHKKTDDRPFGGGPGMVMIAAPILAAVKKVTGAITRRKTGKRTKVIILAPKGKQFTNTYAAQLAKRYDNIILIAGRYEGIDVRVKKVLKAEEVSIGPFVLTGGELPAAIIVDAVARQIPGVLGNETSVEEKRVASGEMYTRPEVLTYGDKKYRVPKVLLSGDHKKIEEWRKRT